MLFTFHSKVRTASYDRDMNQIYQLIFNIYLKTPTGIKRFGYIKLHPKEYYTGGSTVAKWYPILGVADPIGSRHNVGNLLMNIEFISKDDFNDSNAYRKPMREGAKTMYDLRCFVYQGRNLPSADENGLADPFVRMHLMDKTAEHIIQRGQEVPEDKRDNRSSVRECTVNPVWYDVLEIKDISLPYPSELSMAPDIMLEIFDKDDGFFGDETEELMGQCKVCAISLLSLLL